MSSAYDKQGNVQVTNNSMAKTSEHQCSITSIHQYNSSKHAMQYNNIHSISMSAITVDVHHRNSGLEVSQRAVWALLLTFLRDNPQIPVVSVFGQCSVGIFTWPLWSWDTDTLIGIIRSSFISFCMLNSASICLVDKLILLTLHHHLKLAQLECSMTRTFPCQWWWYPCPGTWNWAQTPLPCSQQFFWRCVLSLACAKKGHSVLCVWEEFAHVH